MKHPTDEIRRTPAGNVRAVICSLSRAERSALPSRGHPFHDAIPDHTEPG
jgi:hypothetical protein